MTTDPDTLRDAVLEIDKRLTAIEGAIPEMGKAMGIAAAGIQRIVADMAALAKRIDALERRGKLRAV